MGWSVVLHLSDGDARSMASTPAGVADLAAALSEAVGSDSYPGHLPPLTCGPWQRVGSVHSSTRVELAASETGAVFGAPAEPSAVFVPSTSGAISSAELSRHLRAGRMPSVPSTVSSLASVWHLHADALSSRVDWVGVVEGMLPLLDSAAPRGVRVGSHVEGLVKAGSVIAPGTVPLVWAGNLITVSALEPVEAW